MKTLDMHQMEKIKAEGGSVYCAGLSLVAVATASLNAISGPVGWGLIASGMAFGFGSGLVIGTECYTNVRL